LGNEKWEGMKKGQHGVSVGKKATRKLGNGNFGNGKNGNWQLEVEVRFRQ